MKSLYTKFAVTTIAIMVLSGLFSFVISNAYYQTKLKPYNDAKITRFANNIAGYVSSHGTLQLEDYFQHVADIGYQIYVVDEQEEGHFYGTAFRQKALSSTIQQQVLDGKTYHGVSDFPHKTFVTGFFANELDNTIGVPFEFNGKKYALFIRPDLKLLFNEMHILFGWMLLIAIVISIMFVLISTKYLVKPITKLTSATKEIAEGNFSIKLNIDRRDEIGQLSNSFTIMTHKLEQLEDMRKEFISNISHDIQSPLSNIQGYTKLLEHNLSKDEENLQYVQVIQKESKRLSTLTKQLLLLSQLENNDDILKITEFNLASQIKELLRNHQFSIQEKGLTISYSLPDTIINGDFTLLFSVWENLLTNTIKYNKPNGEIDISISEIGENVVVHFKDTGIGLTKQEINRIFDRFYRADLSRTRSIEGTGLGMSIVARIIHLHHGSITIESEPQIGTTFSISLPKEFT